MSWSEKEKDPARSFGTVAFIADKVARLWFDETDEACGDECHWYRVTVPAHRVQEFREYMRKTAARFGRQALAIELAGEEEPVATHGAAEV